MWAPTANNQFQIGSHVFTVEFHCYLYHLIDALPDYSLPHLSDKSKDFDKLKCEEIEVAVTKTDGSTRNYQKVQFPEVFGQVLDFYLEDTFPIFFPSYEYHILSPKGVVLRHVVLQTNRDDRMYSLLIPALMMNVELGDIQHIEWATSGGKVVYQADFLAIKPPPSIKPQISRSDVHSSHGRKHAALNDSSFSQANKHFPTGPGFGSAAPRSLAVRTAHSVDLRPMTSGIMNQGDLGTCGVSAIASFLEFITGERLSVLFLYWTSRVNVRGELPHNDSGIELVDVIQALQRHGICQNETWPYEVCKFMEQPPAEVFAEAAKFKPASWKPLRNLQEFKDTLQQERPIFCDVFFSPMSYGRHTSQTGCVPKPPETQWDESCEHTCLLMGYDDVREHLIFQNTWGTAWGAQGFGFLPYDYIRRGLFRNAYTWDGDLPVAPFADEVDQ